YLRRDAWVAAADRATYLLETYPQSEFQNDAVAVLVAAYTELGNETLAADARRVLAQNEPDHPYLSGDWPDYPWTIRKLNPFAGEKSAVDNDDRVRDCADRRHDGKRRPRGGVFVCGLCHLACGNARRGGHGIVQSSGWPEERCVDAGSVPGSPLS